MRVALIEPLGDLGIGTYVYELMKALVAAGVTADLYTQPSAPVLALPRAGAIFPVLGGSLLRQQRTAAGPLEPGSIPMPSLPASGPKRPEAPRPSSPYRRARYAYLAAELAAFLRLRHYDAAWTQWPQMGDGFVTFWNAARAIGLPVIHTAHNVLPHERFPGDRALCGNVYDQSGSIIVHSNDARDRMISEFPQLSERIIVSRHGLYTTYPRMREMRDATRRSLDIPAGARMVLFFGGVRPYKNIDGVIESLRGDSSRSNIVVVAGNESGYPDPVPGDWFGHTRQLVERHGVSDRVRFRLGPFTTEQTACLFEASDIVVLPYTESSGSGVLLLAMSYGRFVVATRTGGMDEYLVDYPAHVILDGTSACDIEAGLQKAGQQLALAGTDTVLRTPRLEWSHIVTELIPKLPVSGITTR